MPELEMKGRPKGMPMLSSRSFPTHSSSQSSSLAALITERRDPGRDPLLLATPVRHGSNHRVQDMGISQLAF